MFTRWLFIAVIVAALAYLFPSFDEFQDTVLSSLITIKEKYFSVTFIQDEGDRGASTGLKLFTEAELKKYTGENNGKIYLSILGKVFDVTKGRKHYGKGESYHGFAGKDASKAFISGDFTPSGLTDDISDVSTGDLAELQNWLQIYEKDYVYKGKLIGRFYNERGEPTAFLKSVEDNVHKFNLEKEEENNFSLKYPPCNVEWTPESGSRLWCSKQSGGIKRSWVGVPRKIFEPGSSKYRCACVNIEVTDSEGKFIIYDGCEPDATSCFLKPDS